MPILRIGTGKNGAATEPHCPQSGDTIEGSTGLNLNEVAKARGIVAEFWAQRQERRGKSSYTRILFKQESKLDSEKEYHVRVPIQHNFQCSEMLIRWFKIFPCPKILYAGVP